MNRLQVRLTAVHCWVSTWLGDRLRAGKLSRYVTGHLGQLSLPSCLAGVKAGCVHLCRVEGNTVIPYGK